MREGSRLGGFVCGVCLQRMLTFASATAHVRLRHEGQVDILTVVASIDGDEPASKAELDLIETETALYRDAFGSKVTA